MQGAYMHGVVWSGVAWCGFVVLRVATTAVLLCLRYQVYIISYILRVPPPWSQFLSTISASVHDTTHPPHTEKERENLLPYVSMPSSYVLVMMDSTRLDSGARLLSSQVHLKALGNSHVCLHV